MAEAVSTQLGIGLSASHRLLEDTYYESVFAAIQLHGFRRFIIERPHEFTGQDLDTLRCHLEQYKWDQEKVYRNCQRDIRGLSDSVGITSEDAHCHLKASAWDVDEASKAAKVSKLCSFTGMNPPNARLWLQQHPWDLEKTAKAVELLVTRFANDTGLGLEKYVLCLQDECWYELNARDRYRKEALQELMSLTAISSNDALRILEGAKWNVRTTMFSYRIQAVKCWPTMLGISQKQTMVILKKNEWNLGKVRNWIVDDFAKTYSVSRATAKLFLDRSDWNLFTAQRMYYENEKHMEPHHLIDD